MIRIILVFLAVAAVALTVLALAGDPGRASVVWQGWRLDTTAAAACLFVGAASLAAMIAWRLLLWILETPRRAARARDDLRRRQAAEALTRGFLAAAAGDGSEARRLARKAAELADETPGLARILAAHAAEAAGDPAEAQSAYQAMLDFPEMRLAGRRGLMQLALQAGDRTQALEHAEQAFALARTARWPWRALFEARLEAADWDGALALVRAALDRKIVPPIVADRARAALLAASAAGLEASPDPAARARALEFALEAAKRQPGFAPGVVMAARLLAGDGKFGRAAQALEGAWKASPHPALWLAYRDLHTDETPARRADRLAALVRVNPEPRESRILAIERALVIGDAAAARLGAQALQAEPLTARTAGLFARTAFADAQPDEARMWMARAAQAPQEPDWSDLDPEGRAFAYQPSDWARLVAAFAETGALIHPRHERRERSMGDLPDLPMAYVEPPPAAGFGDQPPVLYPTAAEAYEDEAAAQEPALPPPPAPPPRRSVARRRLASGPRAAK
ncbi:heme biosynthesis protein HemY [Phenylobacterium sp.]|uniref:heme biosynthesis protein HemY n=1 Tax=Phenylobacterium sp. TaxID=1871053 RepID=UPI00273711EF|nr:heme biosynthesis HemY N-terminal domain-containing protein [Phenylobacterium sp.]MDP3660671.1 heme biosynthesis HemY N-terminal domain-containing protein [Phenylobacterium sp.]